MSRRCYRRVSAAGLPCLLSRWVGAAVLGCMLPFAEDLCLEGGEARPLAPGGGGKPGLAAQVVQHLFEPPSLLRGDLGEEDRRTAALLEKDAVPCRRRCRRGPETGFIGVRTDISISSSGTSGRVSRLKRGSSKAAWRAIIPTSGASGRSGIMWPMQPRRQPRFLRVTKTPRDSIAAGEKPRGRGTICTVRKRVIVSRARARSPFLSSSVRVPAVGGLRRGRGRLGGFQA